MNFKHWLENSIVKNPDFNNWFKNSKVVDLEGNPIVVYHQTSKEAAEKGKLVLVKLYNSLKDYLKGSNELSEDEKQHVMEILK